MDPVTHGLIGATLSTSFSDTPSLRPAALLGATAAMLPDLDVLIDSASDPLLQLEYHRQFTHSVLFAPVVALIATLLWWWLVKKRISFRQAYIFSLMGAATAGLADIFTSYGVQLWWPFSTTQFSWNLISVFDPLFSLGLVIALALAVYLKRGGAARWGICWVALYLAFALGQQLRAQNTAESLAHQRNHHPQKVIVKPTIANELLWSIRYVDSDTLYADGVWLMPFTEPVIYEGRSAPLLDWERQYREFKGRTLYKDIARFDALSNGMLIAHPEHKHVIGDGRYAMLPTSVEPLWGIEIDTTAPDQHVNFNTFRDAGPSVRNRFLDMLLGR
ncbi:MAG: metal-dependent hydrolase [Fodinibius sp.]|nr:metal-dependent hydrolase [Fodinibius sp.]